MELRDTTRRALRWVSAAVRSLQTKPQRSYLVSYPKSGRTWFSYMYVFYCMHRLGEADSLKEQSYFGWTPLTHPTVADALQRFEKRFQTAPFVAGHAGVSKGQYANVWEARARVERHRHVPTLLIVRDPRDVVVSYHHHIRAKHGAHGIPHPERIADFIRDENLGVVPLLNFMNAWAGILRTRENVHLIRYEDLRVNTHEGFARSLSALGHRQVDLAAVNFAVEMASFDRQRQAEKRYREGRKPNHALNHQRARRGVVGGYRDELSAADVAYIEDLIRRNLDPCFSQYLAVRGAVAA